jgi:hypothetical protein
MTETKPTPWELLQTLKSQGVSVIETERALLESGLDTESTRVLLNSVAGPLPSEIPTIQVFSPTNLLAPTVFSFSDFGLRGSPLVVGLYWLGFGVAVVLALGVGAVMSATGLIKLPPGVGFYAVRVAGLVAGVCLGWGAYRLWQSVALRRRNASPPDDRAV